MKSLTLCYLLINAWTDIKCRCIDIRYTIIYFAVMSLTMIYQEVPFWWSGCIPGIFLICLSLATKKHVGIGDGIMVLVLGCVIGLEEMLCILQSGFVMASIWGILNRRKKEYSIPFAPCLLLGYLLRIIK